MTAQMLAAVHAALEDDRPRLVYADWLTEQGDPRGEFIHLQCAGVAQPHDPAWEPVLDTPGRFEWVFRRGFPWRVEATGQELTAAAAQIAAEVPTVQDALVRRFDVSAERWLQTPLLPRLEAACFHYLPQEPGAARDALLEAVLGDPRMQHLTRFGISYSYLNEIEWRAIAHAPLIPRLQSLDLGLCNATNAGLAALMPRVPALKRFTAANGRVGTLGCEAVAQAPNALEVLDLSWNRIGVKGARALARLAGVRVLDLSHCQIGDEGCAAIAKGLPALTVLRVAQCRLTEKGARLLADKPGLTQLDLQANGLSDEVLADCARRLAGSRPA